MNVDDDDDDDDATSGPTVIKSQTSEVRYNGFNFCEWKIVRGYTTRTRG